MPTLNQTSPFTAPVLDESRAGASTLRPFNNRPGPGMYSRAEYSRVSKIPGYSLIVMVDDNPADVMLVREALAWNNVKAHLVIAQDGDEAVRFIDEIESRLLPCPDLVILDLNLPKKTGFQVLERFRASSRCAETPVVILSSSEAIVDKEKSVQMGASSYIRKPSNLQDFMLVGEHLKGMLPRGD